ncbi:HAMP domain-containing histidine kinase [Streptomonospora sp. S1-112]|uniref:histidine kinase n=1 Tax=Streptomonospora mangrovi TaxID=2883123 RepID=A0A9X3NTY9_9ACTN|nr:HAMP domain-containing sensor histidine kinase [Streptomonospora mangrovi]MDA0567954.1 HAMP domain-containing histidine kinase [Streptomonospora mangrovi]
MPRPAPGVPPLSEWRLGTRFAVLFALVAAVVIAVVGSLAYNTAAFMIRTDAQSEFDATVSNLTDELRGAAQPPGYGDRTLTLLHSNSFTYQMVSPDGGVSLPIRPGEQVRFLPTGEEDRAIALEEEPGVVRTREDTADGERYRIATVSLGDGQGALQIGQRLSPTERMLDQLGWQMLGVGVTVLIGAAVAGWLVGRGVTGRLVRLTEAAEYVSATGRLDYPMPGGDNGAAGRDEVGRLGNAFSAMLARLAGAKEEQRRLVQNASHELRTPLTSVRTNVSVMKRFERLSPEARERLIDDLQSETRELTDLVNELVELATDSREDERPRELHLGETAERVAERTRRRTGREVVVDADDTVVMGRPTALERALSNPVENAAKFDPEGTEPIEIVVREGRVEVRDRGPGIDPAELAHIFERFYRATSARSLPGSGLGLSMVQDIVTAHGGRVLAHNRPDGGAVVGFWLPPLPPEARSPDAAE